MCVSWPWRRVGPSLASFWGRSWAGKIFVDLGLKFGCNSIGWYNIVYCIVYNISPACEPVKEGQRMFERILATDSWKRFVSPFFSKFHPPFYLLKTLYNIIFSLWRFTNWLCNKSWNWNTIFSFFQVWTNIFWIIWQHKKIWYKISLIHFTPEGYKTNQLSISFLCALGFCFRGGLNVVTMEIIKIVTTFHFQFE